MAKVRLVQLSDVQPGDRLARDVLSKDGRVLLSAGVRLSPPCMKLLTTHGVDAVYLSAGPGSDRKVPEVSRRLRQELSAELCGVLDQVQAAVRQAGSDLSLPTVPFQTAGLRRAVVQVVSEVVAHPVAAATLQELRHADEYTLLHSVEVCVLTTMLGTALGMSRTELVDLAMSGLLHDIGKAGIPPAILNKPGPLTPEETEVMNRHTTIGWLLLRAHPDLPPEAALVALQHHERWGGGGYPLGLVGDQIHPYSRLCAVADVFDALTADRVYRDGIDPTEAVAIMAGPMREVFEPAVLNTFLEAIRQVRQQAHDAAPA